MYKQSSRINPFQFHIFSNSGSQTLHQLHTQCFILKKLSLLPLYESNRQALELYQQTLENIIKNQLFPFGNYQSVKDLVSHLQQYCQILLLRQLSWKHEQMMGKYPEMRTMPMDSEEIRKELKNIVVPEWDRFRTVFMFIEDQVPKQRGYDYIREYVTVRRGLFEDPKKFLQMNMAKKVVSPELKSLIKLCGGIVQKDVSIGQEKPTQKSNQQLSYCQIKTRLRAIALAQQQGDREFLQNINTHILHLPQAQKADLTRYIKDLKIMDSPQKRKISHRNQESQIAQYSQPHSQSSKKSKRSNKLKPPNKSQPQQVFEQNFQQ